jgi:hypothetical protein
VTIVEEADITLQISGLYARIQQHIADHAIADPGHYAACVAVTYRIEGTDVRTVSKRVIDPHGVHASFLRDSGSV